ncbi:MAG: hypothetical protein ACYCX3_00820 [Thermoleophilia bacterium]
MIYRVLGVLSLAIGGVFGVVTMLVLLPFLDNFNLSLLILAGVFAILTYVFVAIGMQLFRPPEGRDRVSGAREQGGEAAALSAPATGAVMWPDTPGESPTKAAPEASTVEVDAVVPTVEGGSVTAPVIERVLPKADPGGAEPDTESGHEPNESSNGGAPLVRPVPAGAAFKKPGAVVPRD